MVGGDSQVGSYYRMQLTPTRSMSTRSFWPLDTSASASAAAVAAGVPLQHLDDVSGEPGLVALERATPPPLLLDAHPSVDILDDDLDKPLHHVSGAKNERKRVAS
jgi:hypothetical protein